MPRNPLRRVDLHLDATPKALAHAVLDNLCYVRGRLPAIATLNDWYVAVAHTVRDRMLREWIETVGRFELEETRAVAYLSAEFLLGPHLANELANLGLEEPMRAALSELGVDLDRVIESEEEPGLGNGGLGRLAACYLDSLATLRIPAVGYGIRYEFGIFDQEIRDGWQVEVTDKWLRYGNPWEIAHPELVYQVGFGGSTTWVVDERGERRVRWEPERVVQGVAYDTPIGGYRVPHVGLLRLWKAEACESFDFQAFNQGDYEGAVESKVESENISKVLYPNDEPAAGKRLRLEQQYLLVSCSLQDMLRLHLLGGGIPEQFDASFAVQLNDTHPSLAVPELMRLLLDVHGLDWDTAWGTTRRTFAYTNHTLLPEALETWPLALFQGLLPRHLEIVYEINARFLDEVRRRFPGDAARVERMSLIGEGDGKRVRMAHLATVGSHAVNGVAALHTRLLTEELLRDFHELEPEKFLNVTNGVTPRRWVLVSNPELADLVTSRIGDRWLVNTEEELPRLEEHLGDEEFLAAWRGVKLACKRRLAARVESTLGTELDPASLFDVQVKRIHEYKRQHLNALHVIALHQRLLRGEDVGPISFVFGGKAAPGYRMAKLVIRLIHGVAEVVNADERTRDALRVVFLPDFNVKSAQLVYPAADLSEQISTAGKEASGTGNMKFALNGALTIGTLDGANVEIREAVGADHFFDFGLKVEEVHALRASGYHPRSYVESNPELGEALELLSEGRYSRGDAGLFRPIVDDLLERDPFLVLADFRSYSDCHDRARAAFRDVHAWTRASVLNVARCGRFSSDRAIREYARSVWKVEPGGLEAARDGEAGRPRRKRASERAGGA